MLAYILALVVGLGSLALYIAAFFFPEVHRKEDFAWSAVGLFYALVLWVCAGRITGGVLLGQMASVALLGWFGWQTLTLRRGLVPAEQQTPVPSQGELADKVKNLSPGGGLQGLPGQATSFFKNRFGKSTPQPQTSQTPVDTQASSPRVTVIDATSTQTASPSPTIEDVQEAIASRVSDTSEAITSSVSDTSEAIASSVSDATQQVQEIASSVSDTTQQVQEAIASSVADTTDKVEELTDTTLTPDITTEEPAADETEPSTSPELIRPNPPDPELIEAAQKSEDSDTPELTELTEEVAVSIEEVAAEVELAPPAEPPGDGDPKMRQELEPENPPTQS